MKGKSDFKPSHTNLNQAVSAITKRGALYKRSSDNKPKEACGVFALSLSGPVDMAPILHGGLKALQHRGEDGCGLACGQGDEDLPIIFKSTDLVDTLFESCKTNGANLVSESAIGHVRYGTQGGNSLEYVQPFSKETGLAVAFNGQIDPGVFASDTEGLYERVRKVIGHIGPESVTELTQAGVTEAFSAVALHEKSVYAFRDKRGTRPLFLAQVKVGNSKGFAIASETCAFEHLHTEKIQEVAPGSLLEIVAGCVVKNVSALKETKKEFCAFEALYFSREDSLYGLEPGVETAYYTIRKNLGRKLASKVFEKNFELDAVVGVPQSGLPAALGFSDRAHVPLEMGLIKNRYSGRSFIQSTEEKRQTVLEDKLHIVKEAVAGKRVAVVDDTLVRGRTMKHIVDSFKKAGALEVHVCIAAPKILSPCTKGVDTGRETKLPASDLNDTELLEYIGAQSITFLETDDLIEVLGSEICLECFKQ